MFKGDTYHLWVPIEDNELNKAIEVDENGDYIVQGVMTSSDKDEENDVIDPEGMDCSYFLEKGWIKYEHGNNPEQFIGEPLEIRVGRFTHPKLNKPVHGIFVKGRLFANRKLAQEAVRTIRDLQKSNTKRCMGWSIEGNVVERDRKTGKIVKSVLRNVVLTMNPVNTMTWVELAKSFANNHQVKIDCEDFEKAMDTGAITEITPQSLEAEKELNSPSEEDQKRFIELLRSFVCNYKLDKSLAVHEMSAEDLEIEAYYYARQQGMKVGDANLFAGFIRQKADVIKSIATRSHGGERMSLLDILNEELEELEKSLDMDDDDEEEKDQEDSDDTEDSEDDDESDESDQEEDSEDDSDDDSEDEDDEDTEKSFRSDLRKSLSKRHRQAFEVSDFLSDMTDEIGLQLQGLQKSITLNNRKQEILIKSIKSLFEVMQDVATTLEAVQAENESLKKSLDEVLNQPLGRRSVVSGREYQTLSKSMQGQGGALTPQRVKEVLEKSFEKGELNGFELARYEAGTPLHMLNLPESVKKELGLV